MVNGKVDEAITEVCFENVYNKLDLVFRIAFKSGNTWHYPLFLWMQAVFP